MKIAGEYTFDADRAAVWEALQDPVVLASVLPGCDKLEQTGEGAYQGILNLKVGPVQGKFQGKVALVDIDPPNGYTMQVDGRGAPGFVKATGAVRLEDRDGKTHLRYEGEAQVGGRVASVGQRLVESSAKSIVRQSLEGLGASLGVREGGQDGASEAAPPAEAPTQAEFAARVAKDVAKDVIPKPVWLIGVVLLVLALLYWVVF
ncbi:MAG: carbon monoxide dehydrogenase subunit G [Acidobacteriota bacterium]